MVQESLITPLRNKKMVPHTVFYLHGCFSEVSKKTLSRGSPVFGKKYILDWSEIVLDIFKLFLKKKEHVLDIAKKHCEQKLRILF